MHKKPTDNCRTQGVPKVWVDNDHYESDILGVSEDVIAVVIIDLNEELLNPFELGSFIKKNYHLPVFGVLNKFSKTMQDNAKSNGFDLIFTKKMLIRSIRDVIIHVSIE